MLKRLTILTGIVASLSAPGFGHDTKAGSAHHQACANGIVDPSCGTATGSPDEVTLTEEERLENAQSEDSVAAPAHVHAHTDHSDPAVAKVPVASPPLEPAVAVTPVKPDETKEPVAAKPLAVARPASEPAPKVATQKPQKPLDQPAPKNKVPAPKPKTVAKKTLTAPAKTAETAAPPNKKPRKRKVKVITSIY